MIVDVDINPFSFSYFRKRTNSAFLPGIYQDQPFDMGQGNLFQFGKIEKIGSGMDEEIPEIFFMRSGKQEQLSGIACLLRAWRKGRQNRH